MSPASQVSVFEWYFIVCNTKNMLLFHMTGTLKMLIKNRLSRQAFHTFLDVEHAGNGQLLSAYLVFEGIKKDSKKDLPTAKTKLCAAMYSIRHISSSVLTGAERVENQLYLITQGLRDDVIALTIEDLDRKLSQAQDEILLIMTPFYDRFLKSASYNEFEVTNKAKEIRSYNENTSSVETLGRQSSELNDSRRTSVLTASRGTSNQNLTSRRTSTAASRRASISSIGRNVSDGRIFECDPNSELPSTGTIHEVENRAEITISGGVVSDPVPISEPSKAENESPNFLSHGTNMTSDRYAIVTDLKEYDPSCPHLSMVPECAA